MSSLDSQMTSLDSYLRGTYKEDRTFLKKLSSTIEEVIPIFYKRTKRLSTLNVLTWPYAVLGNSNEEGESNEDFSASTHCMILFALNAFIPRNENEYSFSLGEGFRPWNLGGSAVEIESLQKIILDAKRALITELKRKSPGEPIVTSTTYGRNDPFTLTWLMELAFRFQADDLGPVGDHLDECQKKICTAVKGALDRPSILNTEGSTGNFTEVRSSFLEMRHLRLAKTATNLASDLSQATKEWFKKEVPDYWKNFDATIHRQLSYWAMGDSRFDPAELAFSFEGALLLHPNWVSASTIDQVFEALQLSKDRQPYWRPLTPFLANNRGHVLFLISIEVANSILRSCEILDREDARPTRFSQIEPQLRTYATWLLGEMEEIPEGNLVGWRTEYEDKRDRPSTIHLWYTSHVLIFLTHYHSLLRRKIGADGVEAAGLHITYKTKIYKDFWHDEPLPSLAPTGEEHYAVLGRIERQYINSRENLEQARKAPQSMLLYGPPGTGKTTLAEQMAARLKRPLIVVTVSDFLAAGAAEIENRAKGVFEVLRSQENVVVLFDEIDQFLLDRNSGLYQAQSDVFKFMTPGMLTKLQDLRDAEGCIFIVATNYYERVDSAIKRRGRIDDRFLLCVPDQIQRRKLLERFVLNRFKGELKNQEARKKYEAAVGQDVDKRAFLDDISNNRDYRVNDLKDPAGLIRRLRDDAAPLSQHLWQSLSSEAQEQLANYDGGSPSEPLRIVIVNELNRLSRGPSLFEEQRFAKVRLREETQKLAEGPPQGEEIIRLNRSLLEDAYPDEIVRDHSFEKTDFEGALRDKRVLEKTPLYGWGDLKNLVEQKTIIKPGMNTKSLAQAFVDAIRQVDSSVSLSAYRNRFDEKRSTFPIEEFFLLLYLVAECSDKEGRDKFSHSDRLTIEHILARIRDFYGDDFELLVSEELIGDQQVIDTAREVWQAFPPKKDNNEGEKTKVQPEEL